MYNAETGLWDHLQEGPFTEIALDRPGVCIYLKASFVSHTPRLPTFISTMLPPPPRVPAEATIPHFFPSRA